ncbi:ty3-gypsy retrotransposon protein, partial [Tanacetum coccineum]
EHRTLEEVSVLIQRLQQGEVIEGFRVQDGLLIFQDRYYVGLESKLKLPLLKEFHKTRSAGHYATKKMMVGLSAIFYWKGMRKMDDFVRTCLVCQQTKYSTQAPGGLLQPLPIPEALTKYAHFGSLPTSYNAHRVAELFMDIVVKHHGFPKAVVSDQDAIFVSQFWSSLFKLSVVQYLGWAEFCYNSSYHSSIRKSLYQALYRKLPLSLIPYPPEKSKLASLKDMLVERDMLIRHLKDNLAVAKNRMETHANQKRREVEFSVGDKVSERFEAGGVHALPVDFEEGSSIEQPLSICGVRSVLSQGKPATQVLVLFEEEGNDTQPTVEGPRRTGRVYVTPKWQRDFVMDKS